MSENAESKQCGDRSDHGVQPMDLFVYFDSFRDSIDQNEQGNRLL